MAIIKQATVGTEEVIEIEIEGFEDYTTVGIGHVLPDDYTEQEWWEHVWLEGWEWFWGQTPDGPYSPTYEELLAQGWGGKDYEPPYEVFYPEGGNWREWGEERCLVGYPSRQKWDAWVFEGLIWDENWEPPSWKKWLNHWTIRGRTILARASGMVFPPLVAGIGGLPPAMLFFVPLLLSGGAGGAQKRGVKK